MGSQYEHMWVDERGSDVLKLAECRQLLAIGAKEHRVGHVAIPSREAPTLLPVDYSVDGPDVLIQVGEGLFENIIGQLVAFEVEIVDAERPWSVLVRGLAQPMAWESTPTRLPSPRAAHPGHRLVRIRADIVTGRRLGSRADQSG
jgi:hypothetical protein